MYVGELCVDILQLNKGDSYVLVGVHRGKPRMAMSKHIESKSMIDVCQGLREMITDLEYMWRMPFIRRIHSDQEAAVTSDYCKREWAKRAARITTTQGHDPQGNELAERFDGHISSTDELPPGDEPLSDFSIRF